MEEDIYLDKLVRRDIKPTAIRLLVIKEMMQAERAVSLLDLETLLDTVDKSTISRTIALFLSHHLIHSIDDGSGSWILNQQPFREYFLYAHAFIYAVYAIVWYRIYIRIFIVRNVIGHSAWKVPISR